MHSDFAVSFMVPHEQVKDDMVEATPERCQGKMSNMIVEMNQMISDLEQSGQGYGGVEPATPVRTEQDTNFGSFENRSTAALDLRSSFLRDRPIYIGYMWHLLNKHHLLYSSLQQLADTVAARNGARGVPSVILQEGEEDDVEGDDIDEGSASLLSKRTIDSAGGVKIATSIDQLISKTDQQSQQQFELAHQQMQSTRRATITTNYVALRRESDSLKVKKRKLQFGKLQAESGKKKE